MKDTIVKLIALVLSLLNIERLRLVADAILDVIEKSVEESSTKVDDVLVLPLCKRIREAFNIPDND